LGGEISRGLSSEKEQPKKAEESDFVKSESSFLPREKRKIKGWHCRKPRGPSLEAEESKIVKHGSNFEAEEEEEESPVVELFH